VKRLVVVGVVMVLALAGLMAFRLFRLGPSDGLDCGSSQRGVTTLDHADSKGHGETADEEIVGSDLWKFLGLPQSSWMLATDDEPPESGLLRVEPLIAREGRAEYLVYRDGLTVARVSVGRLGGRYAVTGYTSC
jgi:hypothetical protein